MANFLVIEDEVNVSSFIKRGLEEEGHSVEVAFDGAMGLSIATHREFDLIILDLILPQLNGIEFCQRFRSTVGYAIPIIMLTALGSSDDIVKGLNTGADDYLVKPFKFKELIARINSLLRRRNLGNFTDKYTFADVVMETGTKTVTRSGQKLQLTSKEYRLLEFLLANPGRVLSKTTLLENVWDNNVDLNTSIVEVYINYLRNKLEAGFNRKLIHTVIGMGYVLKEE